jgi:hypothetical protein
MRITSTYCILVAVALCLPPCLHADPCAELNSTIASMAPNGGHVDATGFGSNPVCNVTLEVNVPVTIDFGEAIWTFNGRPGIHLSASGPVTLKGVPFQYAYSPSQSPGGGTVFVSGVPAPLILDDWSLGNHFSNMELNGDKVGTFGFLGPLSGGMVWSNVHIHHFSYAGLIALGGVNTYHDMLVNSNGSDGLVITSDSVMDGNTQIALNGGVGLHILSSGNRITNVDSDHNTLHGIYLDGRVPDDWHATHVYVVPTLIKPQNGNPGGFYFMSVNVNGKSNNTAPAWIQTPDALVTDGSVVWLNLGGMQAYQLGSVSVNLISGGYVDDNGVGEPAGFVSDNIRIEGTQLAQNAFSAQWNHVDGTHVAQAQVTEYQVTGIHIMNSSNTVATSVDWVGGAYGDHKSGDSGGIVLENSFSILVSAFTSQLSSSNPVKILSSTYSIVQGITATYTGVSSSDPADTYCVSIDSLSDHISLSNISCISPDQYGRGINNAGTNTTLQGYTNSTNAIPPDRLGTLSAFTDSAGNAAFHSVQSPTASISSLQTSSLSASGEAQFGSVQSASGVMGNLQVSDASGQKASFGFLRASTASLGNVRVQSGLTAEAGAFRSLTASSLSVDSLQASHLTVTEKARFTTSGRSLIPGACETRAVEIPGVTEGSTVSWSISGWMIGRDWGRVTVQPHVQADLVFIAVCNPGSTTIFPARATLNITVLR